MEHMLHQQRACRAASNSCCAAVCCCFSYMFDTLVGVVRREALRLAPAKWRRMVLAGVASCQCRLSGCTQRVSVCAYVLLFERIACGCPFTGSGPHVFPGPSFAAAALGSRHTACLLCPPQQATALLCDSLTSHVLPWNIKWTVPACTVLFDCLLHLPQHCCPVTDGMFSADFS